MIITRTPLRMSFAGGGTDLPAFYRREYGSVVTTAIDKYIYITVNRKFDHRIRASYSITEQVDHVDELKHDLIREALKLVGIAGGVEITSISDVPSHGTGLGSSSSYAVGLLNALYAYQGQMVSAERLGREACTIEIDILGKPIGKQDQYIAAHGGLQYLRFNPDENVFADPIICSRQHIQDLQDRLLLFYTGVTRSANDVLGEQKANTEADPEKFAVLRRMRDMSDLLAMALSQGRLDALGEIMHDGWLLKRTLASGITNDRIDSWYDRARRAGAIGGKLLGAGGGGFLLFYVPPDRRADVVAALSELQALDFQMAPQGCKIIYVE